MPAETINFEASSKVISKYIISFLGNIKRKPLVGFGVVGTNTFTSSELGYCFSNQILLPCTSADSGSLMSAEEGIFLNRSLNCEFFEDSSKSACVELSLLHILALSI